MIVRIAACLGVWGALVPFLLASAGETPLSVGSQLELFVDGFVVHELRGKAELRLHHPVPREVVFVTDQPWEGNTSGYFTIFRDGSILRMYYRGSQSDASQRRVTHPEYTC